MSSEAFVFVPIRDSYYMETVTFQVENTLFKVPRFQFERHSGIFATTFSLPQPAEGAEGTDDKIPFKLDGIKKADFQALLKLLYPMTAIPKLPELKLQEWISVLHLASQWDFLEVRDLAIQHLTSYAEETLDVTDRILLARRYDVSSWLRSAYTELAKRKTLISKEEAAKIGWEITLQICQLREAAVAPPDSAQNPFESVTLGTTFQAEFKRADAAHRPLGSPPRVAAAKSPLASAGAAPATTGATVDPFLPPFPKPAPSESTPDSTNAKPSARPVFKFGAPTATTSSSPSAASPSAASASMTAAASAATSSASSSSTVPAAAPTGIPSSLPQGPRLFTMGAS